MVVELEGKLKDLLAKSSWHIQVLKTVAQINLPDCWVGAGFVRNFVWDVLHGYSSHTPLADIDVVYYDPNDISKKIEKYWERQLLKMSPDEPWSVKNQARMASDYGDRPYQNTEDGLKHWTEKTTAIGVRLSKQGGYEILAPFGLTDLFELKVNPTAHALTRPDVYNQRLAKKKWQKTWPLLEIHTIKN